MLEARSVAVVGASVKPGSLGRQMMDRAAARRLRGRDLPGEPGLRRDPRSAGATRRSPTSPGPVDLAILGVANHRIEQALARRRRGRRPLGRHVLVACTRSPEPGPRRGSPERLARDRARRGHPAVRRQRHGVPQPRRSRLRATGFATPDDHPAGPVTLHLALGLGVRGARVQRPRDRVQPPRLERPGDRDHDGRVHGVRAGAAVDPRARPAAGDRARPGGVPRSSSRAPPRWASRSSR